jgi:hypothetical protein
MCVCVNRISTSTRHQDKYPVSYSIITTTTTIIIAINIITTTTTTVTKER